MTIQQQQKGTNQVFTSSEFEATIDNESLKQLESFLQNGRGANGIGTLINNAYSKSVSGKTVADFLAQAAQISVATSDQPYSTEPGYLVIRNTGGSTGIIEFKEPDMFMPGADSPVIIASFKSAPQLDIPHAGSGYPQP